METIIYLRKSREDINKEDSLANHRQILVNLCNNRNWKYKILEEVASSQSIEKRVQMTELINLIKENKVKRVVVVDVDRLSRENYDLAYLRKLFLEYNIELVTPQKVFDWNNESDLMLFGFSSIIGENEYRQIRKRMLLGKQIGAENGIWVSGQPPLGYKKDKNTRELILVDEEVELINYIVKCYIEGEYNNHTLAQHLNELGYRGRRGALWDAGRLWHLMNNRAYLGEVRYNNKWYKGNHKAIISLENWNKIQLQLKGNRIITPRKTTRKKEKLSGICKCGICGRTLTVIRDYRRNKNFIKCHYKDKLTNVRCINRSLQEQIIAKEIEIAIEKHIEDMQNFLNSEGKEYQDTQTKAYMEQIEGLNIQLEKLNNRMINTKEMTKEGLITLSECKEELKSINDKINEVEKDIDMITDLLRNMNKDIEKELIYFQSIYIKLKEKLDSEEYNSLLRCIVSKATITRIEDNVSIDIKFI